MLFDVRPRPFPSDVVFGAFFGDLRRSRAAWPAVQVDHGSESVRWRFELPGFAPSDVEVELGGGELVVRAERGPARRSWSIRTDVTDVRAAMENGVLEVVGRRAVERQRIGVATSLAELSSPAASESSSGLPVAEPDGNTDGDQAAPQSL